MGVRDIPMETAPFPMSRMRLSAFAKSRSGRAGVPDIPMAWAFLVSRWRLDAVLDIPKSGACQLT
jgi:hypothetical protein